MAVNKGEIGIYGVLKNDTPDAVIAYAEQIKDTKENKTQQDINKEVRASVSGLGDTKVDKVDGKSLISDSDITKLAGIEAGAQVNKVTSVAGRTGAVVLTKTDVGLANVDNTSDKAKPVSDATQSALDLKVDKVDGKGLSTEDFTSALKTKLDGVAAGAEVNVQSDWNVTDTSSDAFIKNKPTSMPASDVSAWAKAATKPSYTKSEVGLGNVDNTSDANKPVSTAQQTALDGKVDKVSGKGLSTNDYTTAEKNKLAGIANNANNYSLPTASASVLGGVKVGANLSISSGVLSANEQLKWRTIE